MFRYQICQFEYASNYRAEEKPDWLIFTSRGDDSFRASGEHSACPTQQSMNRCNGPRSAVAAGDQM